MPDVGVKRFLPARTLDDRRQMGVERAFARVWASGVAFGLRGDTPPTTRRGSDRPRAGLQASTPP